MITSSDPPAGSSASQAVLPATEHSSGPTAGPPLPAWDPPLSLSQTPAPPSSILTLPLQCQSPLQPPGPASCPGLCHRQPPPKPCATSTPAPTLGIQADTGAMARSEQGKLRASQRLDLGRKRSQRGWEEKHGQGLCRALWDGWARHCDGSELCTAHPSLAPALRQSPMPPSMVIHLPSPDVPSPRGRAPAWSAGTVPLFWRVQP